MENLSKQELIAIILKQNEIIAIMAEEISELKERLNRNSTNSSKPPSSDGAGKPPVKSLREKTGRKPGGQRGHPGSGLKLEREPDEVIAVEPSECIGCGNGLSGMPMFHADARYVYDVQIAVKLTEYDIQESVCLDCGTLTRAEIPSECRGTLNYGNTIRALSIVLTNYANVSIDKTHKILRDLIGLPISTGTINSITKQFASMTDDTVEQIKKNLSNSPVLHTDETGGRVNGRTQWFHVASTSKYTLITVHRKRGREGSEAGGVLPDYTGNLVHDCWKAYFGFDKCRHSLCCAHLLRELNALIEQGHQWAAQMKSLLLDMKKVVDRYKSNDKTELSRYYLDKFEALYSDALERAKTEIVPSVTRKKTKAENLLIRLEEYRSEITRFINDFDVPFDNNQAERDIRNIKVK
jgi:transposase